MTRRQRVILSVAGLGAAFIGAALLRGWQTHRPPEEKRARSTLGSRSAPLIGTESADTLMALLVRKAPFRWSRRALTPSPIVPGMMAPGAAAPPAPPKPILLLAGIVWGRHALAVLEGVPGTSEPRVVVEGDTAGGLRVRSVARDRVVVTGFDTVWTLQLKARWP
jgi:hypothetical protein